MYVYGACLFLCLFLCLLLPLVPRYNRCMYVAHVFMSVVVTVWGSVGKFVV